MGSRGSWVRRSELRGESGFPNGDPFGVDLYLLVIVCRFQLARLHIFAMKQSVPLVILFKVPAVEEMIAVYTDVRSHGSPKSAVYADGHLP